MNKILKMFEGNIEITNFIFSLDEVYSLESYELMLSVSTCFSKEDYLNKDKINNETNVRAIFVVNENTEKELILKRSDVKKIYAILKIIYKENYMYLLINKSPKYEPNEVLNKINSINNIHGYIRMKLKIVEFPLKHYYLEEKTGSQDKHFDKIFEIKKKSKNSLKEPINQIYNSEYTKMVINNNKKEIIQNNATNILNENINKDNNINNSIQNYQGNNLNFNINNNSNNNYNQNNININGNYNQLNDTNNNSNYLGNNNTNNFIPINNINNNNNNFFSNNNINQNNLMSNTYNQQYNNSWNQSNNMQCNTFNPGLNMNQINLMNCNSTPNPNNNFIQNNNCINPIYNNMSINNNHMMTSPSFFNNMNNLNSNNPNQLVNINQNNNVNNQNIQKGVDNDANDFELFFNDKAELKHLFPFVGLKNVGLTCYMNSTLQCLLHIPELNYYFLNEYQNQKDNLLKKNESSETHGCLSESYYQLLYSVFNKVWENEDNKFRENLKVSPIQFHTIIGNLNPQFARIEANDSKDLLIYLFQSMHEELNYFGDRTLQYVPRCNQDIASEALNFFLEVNNNLNLSIFSYLFYGIFKSTTKCTKCNNRFYNFQHFQIISFPLYNYVHEEMFNLYRGFKDFIKPEMMQGDNQCYCKKCGKLTDCEVNTIIYYPPPYLIINLDYGKNKKFTPKKIDFGEALSLSGFTEVKNDDINYKLIAVSSHIGRSGNSGHYIAYCKDPSDDSWYEFNDSYISKANLEDVKKYSPYFLIYKKETRK